MVVKLSNFEKNMARQLKKQLNSMRVEKALAFARAVGILTSDNKLSERFATHVNQ